MTMTKDMQAAFDKANASLDGSGVFEKSIAGFLDLFEALEEKPDPVTGGAETLTSLTHREALTPRININGLLKEK